MLFRSDGNQSLVRRYDPLFRELYLDDRFISDNEFWTAIFEHPTLINGPVVVNGNKACICRSADEVRVFLGLAAPKAEKPRDNSRLAALGKGAAGAKAAEPPKPAEPVVPAKDTAKKADTAPAKTAKPPAMIEAKVAAKVPAKVKAPDKPVKKAVAAKKPAKPAAKAKAAPKKIKRTGRK